MKNDKIYTPPFITNFINTRLLDRLGAIDDNFCAIDLSCGEGAFLIDLAHKLHARTGKSFKYIIENWLYGIEIEEKAVRTLKNALRRLAREKVATNIYCANSLDREAVRSLLGRKFKLINGNPPYVRIQDMELHERGHIKSWKLVEGNTDLYICFYELGLDLLDEGGVLGYISPNSFLKNKSGRLLCEAIKDHVFEIIDFREHLLFNVSTYTAICLLQKGNKSVTRNLVPSDKFCVPCTDLFATDILEEADQEYKFKIENAGSTLGELFDIKVGLATLADSIFYLRELGEIESEMVKDCVKVSRIKTEQDIKIADHIIFPYKWKNKYVPMTEDELKAFPNCYEYLLSHKEKLLSRDRGKIKESEWFLYGRTQGLNSLWGEKLLIPPLQQDPVFVYSGDPKMLYLSGYAILGDKSDLHLAKRVLESKVMEIYSSQFKRMRNGWKSYSKEAIKNFSIPKFTEAEKLLILNSGNDELNDFLLQRYGL